MTETKTPQRGATWFLDELDALHRRTHQLEEQIDAGLVHDLKTRTLLSYMRDSIARIEHELDKPRMPR